MQEANETACYSDFTEAIKLDETNADIYHHRGQVGLFPNILLDVGVTRINGPASTHDSRKIALELQN